MVVENVGKKDLVWKVFSLDNRKGKVYGIVNNILEKKNLVDSLIGFFFRVVLQKAVP